jgi:hypothetical protein
MREINDLADGLADFDGRIARVHTIDITRHRSTARLDADLFARQAPLGREDPERADRRMTAHLHLVPRNPEPEDVVRLEPW